MTIIKLIREIRKLKKSKGVPFQNVRYREYKKELLSLMTGEIMKVGSYVLVKGYLNKDAAKPFVMIYTKRSWAKREWFLEENKIKSAKLI